MGIPRQYCFRCLSVPLKEMSPVTNLYYQHPLTKTCSAITLQRIPKETKISQDHSNLRISSQLMGSAHFYAKGYISQTT